MSHDESDAGHPPRTIDMTGEDYAFTPMDGGQRGRISCHNAYRNDAVPRVGDALILRNPDGRTIKSARYRVASVRRPWDVDPPTMWMADLVFDPRSGVIS
jgi:hypothetical protein